MGLEWATFVKEPPFPLVGLAVDLATHVKWHADTTWHRWRALLDEGSNAIKCLEAFRKTLETFTMTLLTIWLISRLDSGDTAGISSFCSHLPSPPPPLVLPACLGCASKGLVITVPCVGRSLRFQSQDPFKGRDQLFSIFVSPILSTYIGN